ncbi:hypothetical protein [Lactococcus phage P1048]|uniref:MafI family immunity protein n=1 Tax=Lactococcus phage P1048 TaxID=2662295 RepID=A0A649V240_9CAUD|nr:hypothetical protein H1Z36_gp016 [Lactococcus phage P1048]QGJ84897.1 hypothetical protein [Lactococcus phage P1048]
MKITPREEYLLNCLRHISETSSESDVADFAYEAIYISGTFPEEKSIVEEYLELVNELWECCRSEEPPLYDLYERFEELNIK